MPHLTDAIESFKRALEEEKRQNAPVKITNEKSANDPTRHYYFTLRKELFSNCKGDSKYLTSLLEQLEKLASEFDRNVEENAAVKDETKWSACVALLQIFHTSGDRPGQTELNQIEANFGFISDQSLVKRAAKCVDHIRMAVGPANFRHVLKAAPNFVMLKDLAMRRKQTNRRRKRIEKSNKNKEQVAMFGDSIDVKIPKKRSLYDFSADFPEIVWKERQMEPMEDAESASKAAFQVAEAMAQPSSHPSQQTGRRWELTVAGVIEELSTSYEDASFISTQLFGLLESEKSSDDLQNELIDLLGVDKFDLLMKVLERRNELVAEFRMSKDVAASGSYPSAAARESSNQKNIHKKTPNYGQQIVVQSSVEVDLQKELRKDKKKQQREMTKLTHFLGDERLAMEVSNIEEIRRRELELEFAQSGPVMREERIEAWQTFQQEMRKYPYVFDAMATSGRCNLSVNGCKFVLPDDTARKDRRNYEEIHVPAVGRDSRPNLGPLRAVAQMDPQAQLGFGGITNLNVIQSVVYGQAYGTNENLLICAPTGAGKTNIAMLTVLRTIKDHTVNGKVAKGEFKIVYIAPMKALATEMTRSFAKRLAPLGIQVRELTGDTQLSKKEIADTQMLVVTPEKWDVVTRKSTGDVGLALQVRLLIIDEVHLLHDDRGPVIETLVARTLRQVEMRQTSIRIVGLSATLPNYVDVARFLHVNPEKGLFFFDARFRPVPLSQTFIGLKTTGNIREQMGQMDEICYDKVVHFVKDGHQVLVFVHARNATGKLALTMREMANNNGDAELFAPDKHNKSYGTAQQAVQKSRNRQLQDLFQFGFGIHHAGMVRQDRILVERLFAEGHIKVLCCTATLAWGVNLPAHAVVIRGTDIYDAEKGAFVDLGILDVQQIFGRAGRPQFDTSGHGVIITNQSKLFRYLAMLTRQAPIESQFLNKICDNLNAEIVLGTVSNRDEAVEWLSYSYFFVRAQLNPLAYGIPYKAKTDDPQLFEYRHQLIAHAAQKLDQYQMIRYDDRNGLFHSTDLGRIASHYYVKTDTVELIVSGDGTAKMTHFMTDDAVLNLIAHAKEFDQLKVREEEMGEMETIMATSCHLPLKGGGLESKEGKVNCLMQAYLSRTYMTSFSLISDSAYISANVCRICRAFFEVALRKNWAQATAAFLTMAKGLEKRIWPFETPLRQFDDLVRFEWITKIEENRKLTFDKLREMDEKELGAMLRADGKRIHDAAWTVPVLDIDLSVRPITRGILQIQLNIVGAFNWNVKYHGKGTQGFWIWIENPDENYIYHHDYFLISKKQVDTHEMQRLTFTIPVSDRQMPSQYLVHAASDHWVGPETVVPVSFHNIVLPDQHRPHTDLLNLRPLPVTALGDEKLQSLFSFPFFNAVQTQIFHCLYHTDRNVLVGAPTGSGKTVAAELAIFKVFREQPDKKCVYIAPMKALVRERMKDWGVKIQRELGKRVVELTGDITPDVAAIREAALIVTTPEKWDGVSRSWQTRGYVKDVVLVVIDEIHLLGVDRGPVLEVIVARMNFMAQETGRKVRVVGLSTALANAGDIADWLGIEKMGLYNFRPSVRPVPTEVHIAGFPGRHYCPRMASMNKPVFQAIKQHSPEKPSLIFVASRRQTRLTALDLIALLAAEQNPRVWLHMLPEEMDAVIESVRDQNLKLALAFGIGLHHAGLHENDRGIVEELFVNHKIQVLIATATLAWGVNFPAHLVIVKGTEYFDAKLCRYVDFPVTDVLQMIGRAGRPQFDDSGVAVVFVQDIKKNFYKKFLYEPFPVESSLQKVLADHLNAEIVAGTVRTKQEAIDYLTWTYFFRRLLGNPSYYGLETLDEKDINRFLTIMIDSSLNELMRSSCIELLEDERSIQSLALGQIASYYYLSHETMRLFRDNMSPTSTLLELLKILTDVKEYDEIPVRHNENLVNGDLQRLLPIKLPVDMMDSAHGKTHLLYQAHFSRAPLPSSDYLTDLKSVLDQGIRILQAMLDVAADQGWLNTSVNVITLLQMVVQARWHTDPLLTCLPHVDAVVAEGLRPIETVPQLQVALAKNGVDFLLKATRGQMGPDEVNSMAKAAQQWPTARVGGVKLRGWWAKASQEQRVAIEISRNDRSRKEWRAVHADQPYLLMIDLERLGAANKRDTKAVAPRFPKPKDAGWMVVVGSKETGELIALKRIGPLKGRTSANVELRMPTTTGRLAYELLLLSDSYLGIDQQYELRFDVLPAAIDAQFNAEVGE
uniref:Activating signal cointegrator 1 complex subunit 3 n=1 Tax=Plectus sambesii TaxID=2011161 RepID=A0A914XKB1_9BILA